MYHPAAALRTAAIERESFDDIAGLPGALIGRPASGATSRSRQPRRRSPGRKSFPPRPYRRHRRRPVRRVAAQAHGHIDQPPCSEPPNQGPYADPEEPNHSRRAGPPLRIIPLGGVGEIGKNMYVFEYGDEIVVIDCGLMFPDEEMFGIDLVVPDVTYLKENRDKVKAFLITHAHEDHVGGLPYVLPEFPGVPVYASRWPAGCSATRSRSTSSTTTRSCRSIRATRSRSGHSASRPSASGHSIPDAMGIALAHPGRDHRPHGRLQVRPHAGRRQAVRLRDPREARHRGGHLPAVGLDECREARLHPVRTDGRRGVSRDHGTARRPGHRGDLREQHRPRPAGPRRRGRHGSERLGHRAVDGAELPDRHGSGLPDVRALDDRVQGQDQGPSGPQARHRHDRRPGRADGRLARMAEP